MIILTSVQKNYLPLEEHQVKNEHCPLCKTIGGLHMQFYQLQLQADWVINSRQITATCFCATCKQDVPNIRWSKEMQAFYQLTKRNIKVKTSYKIGKKGKFLLGLFLFVFGGIFIFLAGIYIYYHFIK
jgi:hypothetical protein